ncbi:MAG: hypothetical protein MUO99_04270 [Dehalococcoidales bacterium]|nr:hypothetical protein [Dehalococcoidales bacterium]
MSLKFVPITLEDGSTVELISVTSMLHLFENKEVAGTRSYYRGESASIDGKEIHRIIQFINRGGHVEAGEWNAYNENVRQAVRAYVRWQQATGYRSKLSEYPVYSLELGLAGTLDDLGTIKRYCTICDWTSGLPKKLYKKYQLVTYRQLYLSMFPRRRVSGLRVVILNKQTGNFEQEVLTENEVLNLFNEVLELKNKVGIV